MSTTSIQLAAAIVSILVPVASGGSAAIVPLPGGSDVCSAPELLGGAGPYVFDNSTATTGVEGQTTTNCTFYGQNGLTSDVWFVWTAPANGRVRVMTCGQTSVDTKIAVYAGSACPLAGAAALACNDDITSSGIGNLASLLEIDVAAGGDYLIQLGTYPLAAGGGSGTFSIDYVSTGVTCQYDDGTTDYASEVGADGTLRTTGWIYRMGEIGTATLVSSVSSAWGWTNTGTPLAPGLTGEVGVWEDPNDDGDPSDAVLLGTASAPMVNPHSDLLQMIALPAPVVAHGGFFIGAWVVHTTGFPIPRDILGCNSRPGVGWLVGNAGGPLDAVNLLGNSTPPFQAPNGQTYVYLLRADCQPAPTGTTYCAGDGVTPHTACPCANHSAAGDAVGCLNSFGVGARLRAIGSASLALDTVVLTAQNLPASSVLFFQGTLQQSSGNGAVFGDGLRCAGGTITRLKTATAQGAPGSASSSYPAAGDPSVSVRGGVTQPGTRTYQAWYRNSASFCAASLFNLSNGLEINWQP